MLEFITAIVLYLICAVCTVKSVLYFHWDKQRYKDLDEHDQGLILVCLVFWWTVIIFILYMEVGNILDKWLRKIL